MNWQISLSKDAEKFLAKNKLPKENIFEIIRKSIKKLQGEDVNVDIKKLKGEWQGFYRSRVGKIRIIAEFDFNNCLVFIENIDYRGGVYK
ncbi:hypothetical protein COS21_01805 [bacterium (Candidatus Gribaldobacteria) CG02_land_8_20_14_3_00_41_15]|uniref:Type II toxin-antitoxin system RelE/ParE family toxin n=1 Tax=bacterium (Candidatus Gribaldobacteria) CG02_land_8_20_14_3_00_41_15 TaxID=2014270 RepID=A0A2M7DDZ6_9BACT|nr:MAG: hypothetical protein AUJ36_00595 [Parcubacteria group bacterium CG1_02_41_26]PIV47097.1 MAG: hypothetical protein COS21_01805 [bacterium (Candidatus Gribaldobacteria) CG02_land_8_20_14_3_00_41_15]